MLVRSATHEDRDSIWHMLEPTIRAGETYALPHDMSEDDALAYWMGPDRRTFVAGQDGQIVGTYYLRANQLGGGAHVANGDRRSARSGTGHPRPNGFLRASAMSISSTRSGEETPGFTLDAGAVFDASLIDEDA